MKSDVIDILYAVTGIGLPILVVGSLLYVCYKDFVYNAKETFVNFDELKSDWVVDSFHIPTKGDVVLIEKLDTANYKVKDTVVNGDTIRRYEGNFYYRIRPNRWFAPNPGHTDFYGNTPENPKHDYWGDIRKGVVVLKK